MLKYHLLLPSPTTTHQADYLHYLTTGAHLAPYAFHTLKTVSVITLHPQQMLPSFLHEGLTTQVYPLKGTLISSGK